MTDLPEHPDSFTDKEEPKSSKVVWDALCDAEREFEPWWRLCDHVDRIAGAARDIGVAAVVDGPIFYSDQEFDLFWASMEIVKPAVYSRPPQPVVAPRFQDRDRTATKASEILERCLVSSFERGDFDQVMLNVRDDLIINGRGISRLLYEADSDGKRVCNEHVDRCDFLHEPARKWNEVGWVGFGSYLTEREFKKRFPDWDEAQGSPQYIVRRDGTDNHKLAGTVGKCKVWEVWHKADNRVYWVTEGVEVFLDESKPFLKLEGFFPCPRPAYGSLRRRSMIPTPDYVRYERHLNQINELTRRIYNLLEWIRVKGLIPAGGDVGQAVETALNQADADVLLIPIPSAGLMQGSGQFVQFLPLAEFATAIQGMIEARTQLINDFYQLSGISDIMRGATEAEETLGAQQLKSQFGSVRVREKIDELQRVARDVARISAEIIAEKFDRDTLLEMAQMELPTRAEIKQRMEKLESAARQELEALAQKAGEAASAAQQQGQDIDPAQAQEQFDQAQQQIIAKYEGQIRQASEEVAIEDVMDLLKSQKARAFAIEIETDSTIMTDEIAEKQARGEFLTAFAGASQAIQPLLLAGEAGAKLAGGMIKFALAPFRAGRELDGMIDDFVEEAPQALATQQGNGEADAALAQANLKLAEAEMQKAQAAIAKVQADTAAKHQEIDLKAAEASAKSDADQKRIVLEMEDTRGNIAETFAKIEKIYADIQLAQQKLGLEARREQREGAMAQADMQMRQTDQALQARNDDREASFRAQDGARADRDQSFAERQGNRQEGRADRQQSYAERSGDRQQDLAEKQAAREAT